MFVIISVSICHGQSDEVSNVYDAFQGRWLTGGTLTGWIRTPQKKAIANVCVHAYASPCGDIRQQSVATNADGFFQLSGLAPQSWYLFADASCRKPQNLINIWWNGENGTPQCTKASSVSIQSGATRSHINFTMLTGKVIHGQVINRHGTPIPDVCVAATSHCASQWFSGALTNDKGQFSIQGLPANVYYLHIHPQCSFSRHIKKQVWWIGGNQISSDCQKAVSIALTNVNEITDIVFQIDAQPALTGRVQSITQMPIANVCVNIKGFCKNKWFGSAITDNNGIYSFDTIPQEEFYLQTSVSCQKTQKYINAWWNSRGGHPSCQNAEPIVLKADTSHDFTLQAGNMIQGQVFNKKHQPLPNVCVIASGKCQKDWFGQTITNENGYYNLIVPDGQYYLLTDTSCDTPNFYVNQWWRTQTGALDCQDAQPIEVANSQTKKRINFSLQTGGLLAGNIVSHEKKPLPNTCIAVTRKCDQSVMLIDQTDAHGHFTKVLPAGTYHVKTDYHCKSHPVWTRETHTKTPTKNIFMDQWWKKTQGTPHCKESQAVDIRLGEKSQSIDFVLSSGGIISGRVMAIEGKAIANIPVNIYDVTGQNVVASERTLANGQFEIMVPSGSYLIRAMPSRFRIPNYFINQWWNERTGSVHVQGAQKVPVKDNHRKHILFKLQKGGAVTGMVFTPEHLPLENVQIIASDPQKDIIWAMATTNQHGQFMISGLPRGRQHVYFNPWSGTSHILSNWTLGAITEHSVEIVTEKITRVKPFILPKGGAIKGKIIAQDNVPLANVCVTAVKKCGDVCFGQAKTDDQGDFVIKGLPTGDYYVQTNISCKDDPGDYIDMYWRKNSGTPVCKKAELIHVNKDQTTEKINFSLSRDISFVGNVTDISGEPIENVCVVVSGQCDQEWAGEALSDVKGEFAITGIPPGRYFVHTEVSCYQEQPYLDLWWHSVEPSLSCEFAEPINLNHSNMKVSTHFKLPEKTTRVFDAASQAPLTDGKYEEVVEGGKVVVNIQDDLMDLSVNGVALENVLKIISKYTGIKVLLFGTLKDKIFFDKKRARLDEILLDLINGRAGHIFIYSPNRLMTSYIFSKDGQLKPTTLSSSVSQPSPIQLDLNKPMSIMQPDEIEGILNANGRVEEKIHTLGALIGYFDSENALNFLNTALDDPDEEVRMMAISVMNDLKENHLAVNDLSQSLTRDMSPAVRALAAEALGEIGDKRAVRPLMEALNDRDAGVRDTVRRALQNIQGR